MLPDLSFLLAVLVGLSVFGPGAHEPLLAILGTAALTAISAALNGMSAERALRALEEGEPPEGVQARLLLLPFTPLLAWLVSLETLGWGHAVHDLLPPTTWLLRHVLLFVPALVMFGAAWVARARIEAGIAQRLGRRGPSASALAAVRAGLKRNGLALIPLGILLGLLEGLDLAADLGVPGCALARAALEDVPQLRVAFELLLLGLLALLLPAVLARLISSEPFPAGPQRERLERLAAAMKLRYREMRLWKTGGRGLNAMVVGITPGTRRIFVTDGLLAALPPEEVDAVFCHEAGHAQRGHLLWFLGIVGVLSLLFMLLDEPLTRMGLPEGLLRSMLHLALLWFVVLGSISRHFERESDVDGGAHAALLEPEAPPLSMPGLPAPLPAGATRMVFALKHIETLMGDVYSHRHGAPSERAAYVAYHATHPPTRAAFERRGRLLRLGVLALAALCAALALLRLPSDMELAHASAALRDARAAHDRAFVAHGEQPERATSAWREAHDAYRRAAEGFAASPRLRAQVELPLAWLGQGDTALRGLGDLASARAGLERAITAAQAAPLAGPWRRVIFEATIDLARVALREGRPVAEAAELLAKAERLVWSTQGPSASLARARLRLLEAAIQLAGPEAEAGAQTLRDLSRQGGSEDEWVALRRDAAEELARRPPPPR